MISPKTVTFLIFIGCVLVEILSAKKSADPMDLRPEYCQEIASECTTKSGKRAVVSSKECTLCPKTCKEACAQMRGMIPIWQAEYQANMQDDDYDDDKHNDDVSSLGSSSSSS